MVYVITAAIIYGVSMVIAAIGSPMLRRDRGKTPDLIDLVGGGILGPSVCTIIVWEYLRERSRRRMLAIGAMVSLLAWVVWGFSLGLWPGVAVMGFLIFVGFFSIGPHESAKSFD